MLARNPRCPKRGLSKTGGFALAKAQALEAGSLSDKPAWGCEAGIRIVRIQQVLLRRIQKRLSKRSEPGEGIHPYRRMVV